MNSHSVPNEEVNIDFKSLFAVSDEDVCLSAVKNNVLPFVPQRDCTCVTIKAERRLFFFNL